MKAKEAAPAKVASKPVQSSKPVQPKKPQVKPQAARATQQSKPVTGTTNGSRVPQSAIRALGSDNGGGAKGAAEAVFQQHYGVITPIANKDLEVSQLQGNRPQNIDYAYGAHTGVDYRAPIGTDVRGVKQGGVVKFVGNSGAYGNRVVIEYPDGTSNAFNHLDSADVKVGQRIEKGENFAKSGNTGRTTGAHLDFQSIDKEGVAAAPDKVFDKKSIYGSSQFGGSWKGSQSGVNNFSANIGKSPAGGGGIMASGSENSGSRSSSFDTGTSAASAGYGGFGQQVNLGALNQTSMRGPSSTRAIGAPAPSSPSVGFVPAQSTNPGTVTSIKRA